jgi:mannose-6-phosphate isomerase-like protein (cupin superfamily)
MPSLSRAASAAGSTAAGLAGTWAARAGQSRPQWQPTGLGELLQPHGKAAERRARHRRPAAEQVGQLPGEFVWHQHDDTDEVFIVLAGRLTIRLQGRADVHVGPGQLFVVPRGLPHCPVASQECHLLLVEPAGAPNTGDQPESDRTAAAQWL